MLKINILHDLLLTLFALWLECKAFQLFHFISPPSKAFKFSILEKMRPSEIREVGQYRPFHGFGEIYEFLTTMSAKKNVGLGMSQQHV